MFKYHGPVMLTDLAIIVAIIFLGVLAILVRLSTGLMVQFVPYQNLRDWQGFRVIDRCLVGGRW